MYPVSGCIEVKLWSGKLAKAVARSLSVEAKNPPDPRRGSVRVELKDNTVVVCFEARDLSAARTLVNTYLSLAATTIDAVAGSEKPARVEGLGSEAPPGA